MNPPRPYRRIDLRMIDRSLLMCFVMMLAGASIAPAQRLFEDLGKPAFPTGGSSPRVAALADLDGDGDLDAVVGFGTIPVPGPIPFGGEQDRLYLNDGAGTFVDVTATHFPVDTEVTESFACGDVDLDGDLDLVIGRRLYLNNGAAGFSDVTSTNLPPLLYGSQSVALADLDLDGDLDIVLSDGVCPTMLVNSGSGNFFAISLISCSQPFPVIDIEVGDVDADGDPDLVLSGYVYLNDGFGGFSFGVGTPIIPGPPIVSSMGDVDGDGDLDFIGGNSWGTFLFLNDGSGNFTPAPAASLPIVAGAVQAIELSDVDQDGDLDLYGGTDTGTFLHLNNGAGSFIDQTSARLPADTYPTNSVAIGDVDGDGHPDLLRASLPSPRLYRNDGSGGFAEATVSPLPNTLQQSKALAVGDVDGDGDPDIVAANGLFIGGPLPSTSPQNQLFLNDGTGNFVDATSTNMPTFVASSYAVAMGDVDGDGDLDLAFGNDGDQDRLYLNDGTGTFADVTATHLPTNILGETSSLCFCDVENDGDLDLVLGAGHFPSNPGVAIAQNLLYLNDGTGHFTDATAAQFPIAFDISLAVVSGDVDADGDTDLVFANMSAIGQPANTLYLNDGLGNFADATATHLPVDTEYSSGVAMGDLDNDGDLDLVFSTVVTTFWGPGQNRIYLNDGLGHYTDATALLLPNSGIGGRSLALGDVDGDGDLDLFFVADASQYSLHLNDGVGGFHSTWQNPAPAPPTSLGLVGTASVLHDLDRDGDLDLALSLYTDRTRVYFNLSQHLHAPDRLQPGRDFRLSLYARHGRPSLVDLALPYLSTGHGSIPVGPLGVVGIDLSQAIALDPVVVPQPQGVATLTFSIPNNSGLLGLSLYAQALMIPYPFAAHLTNTTRDVVLP